LRVGGASAAAGSPLSLLHAVVSADLPSRQLAGLAPQTACRPGPMQCHASTGGAALPARTQLVSRRRLGLLNDSRPSS